MNEHGTRPGEQAVDPRPPAYGSTAVRLDEGHVHDSGGLPELFENPGLPPHIPRSADLDEHGARRAEKQVATLFGLSILGTLVFVIAYFAIDTEARGFIPGIGLANLSNVVLGTALAFSLFGIGLGAVHWAKTLMPDVEVVEERHPLRSAQESRSGFVTTILDGGEQAQLGRRPLIKYTLGGALGLFAVPMALQVAGSLGPLPEDELSKTMWKKGDRLVSDPEHTAIRAADVTIGSVFHVLPESIKESHHILEDKAKAAVILMRLHPEDIKVAKERDWGHEGIVAYSKICTHVGCPVGLYEQQTHHLLCPCHQSTFDVTQDCKVIFGPAKRPLPQLKITVDAEGYLVADAPFREAVGPSFWERG
jgi:ubiquinol-cytochrome c reductase iron-sulfur subunit